MVTCVIARKSDCARTTLANSNSAQSTNRVVKIDVKRGDRITKLDTELKPIVSAGDKLFFSPDGASQKGGSTDLGAISR